LARPVIGAANDGVAETVVLGGTLASGGMVEVSAGDVCASVTLVTDATTAHASNATTRAGATNRSRVR
jgi:hypothetical protein